MIPSPNDQLFIAKKIVDGKEVEEGSIPCFVTKGPGILAELRAKIDSLETKVSHLQNSNLQQSATIMNLQNANIHQAATIMNFQNANLQQMAINLNNDLVQMLYGLIHTRLLYFVRDRNLTRGRRVMYYDEIIAQVKSRIENGYTLT